MGDRGLSRGKSVAKFWQNCGKQEMAKLKSLTSKDDWLLSFLQSENCCNHFGCIWTNMCK